MSGQNVMGLAIWLVVIAGVYLWYRRDAKRDREKAEEARIVAGMPPASLSESEVREQALKALDQIYMASGGSHRVPVSLKTHLAEAGLSERDAFEVMRSLVGRRLVHRIGPLYYSLTVVGLRAAKENFMKRSEPNIHISNTGNGSIQGFNINSTNSSAQGGTNRVDDLSTTYRRISATLREDAKNATPLEGESALNHAADLDQAVSSHDQDAIDRSLSRIQRFTGLASSAFSLTRDIVQSISS